MAPSIREFCQAHKLSRTHFYELQKSGAGPSLMRVGRRVLITTQAIAEWHVRMSAVAGRISSDAQKNLRVLKLLTASSIFFEYDSYDIKPEFQTVLPRDADALRSTPRLKIRLEGNADERGGREYNLALGQKRAEAVRRALTLLGIPDAQMEAISHGKEKPRATCHEERCWAENRRVDFAEK